ncbi:transglycosylase [Aliihoeflea aestuarii]|jgi:membrane-bound lytic murein transglycosylase A|uniref:murein transglycosylase A n=1 Tax=Aliihoeflea aestuarii TaxID=453840 RepID=UPI002092EAB7|nr:murein transglycosylase A [Aliihoeflea aestuarii]MCO6391014.1 transglycosylase [Aliihoeflea aestuarii]
MDAPAALSFIAFEDIAGWPGDHHRAAFEAFRRSAFRALEKPYRTGSFGISHEDFAPAFAAARANDRVDCRDFFARHFIPARIATTGFVTGFYEPIIAASPVRTASFQFPILSQPGDLADIDDVNRPAGWDETVVFGRKTDQGFQPYFDRGEIERGALQGRGLELAWVADKVDLFFIHVQGAARLRMTDGTERRVTYAAKTGHPFTAPGRILAENGEIPRENVTMQSIRAWLKANPRRIDEILWQNRSFIFFRDAPVADPALGPVAAAKVPLTAGRSLAVDRLLHSFGTPFFIDVPDMDFARLMIAQDTGSAIVGPARGDIFCGSGDAAGEVAGVIKHAATFTMLVPRTAAERMR